MAIVEQGLRAGLGEAGVLLVDGTLEAIGIGLQIERAGEEVRVVEQSRGVAWRNLLDLFEVLAGARLFKAGLGEVLGGADEDAGAAFDGGAEGGEVAAGLRCEKENGLLGLGWHGDDDAFFDDALLPSLDAREPRVGRWIGGAAEESNDQQVVDGLRRRQVRV